MSYQVIARKWRPQTFEEVTGQDVITRTLHNAIEHDRLHHAYLFSGARGVGKTTTARILAKVLNCHKTPGPNLTPCRTDSPDACPSCIEISESRSMDVLEIDAASHTGIDDVRETILEGINFNPARDRYKVFIIDEVHQLSKPAFNALLKTLEEPPGNVVFVMATTEHHKVPITITSRCQEFQFRTIPLQQIFDRLKIIAESEGVKISDEALREVARSGLGSMRDAQSNFDQAISFSAGEITLDTVAKALGSAGADVIERVVRAIITKNSVELLDVVDELMSHGHDLRNFCRDLLGLMRDLMVYKVSEGSPALLESAIFTDATLRDLSDPFSHSDLIRCFNSLSQTEASLREAAYARYVLEIGLLKLVEMQRLRPIEDVLASLGSFSAIEPKSDPPPVLISSESAAASPEKKTVNSPESFAIEPGPPEMPEEIDDGFAYNFDNEPEMPPFEPFKLSLAVDAHRDDGMAPGRTALAAMTAEELEHFDHDRLDQAYESMITAKDIDTLSPTAARSIAAELLGRGGSVVVTSAGGAAAVMAPSVTELRYPAYEVPPLSAEPTADELLEYANAHPVVRSALEIFEAEILSVAPRGK